MNAPVSSHASPFCAHFSGAEMVRLPGMKWRVSFDSALCGFLQDLLRRYGIEPLVPLRLDVRQGPEGEMKEGRRERAKVRPGSSFSLLYSPVAFLF